MTRGPNDIADEAVGGVDEAGRGPLAGPVVAAAVILDGSNPVEGLADSKSLSGRRREALAQAIKENSLAWSVAHAEVAEIDRLNILQATLLAMKRAVEALPVAPRYVLVDGNQCPDLAVPATAIVQGDRQVPAISAASILAKVTRDQYLLELDRRHPGYGFAGHKGYPTRLHMERLRRLGPCDAHRRSFRPVRELLGSAG